MRRRHGLSAPCERHSPCRADEATAPRPHGREPWRKSCNASSTNKTLKEAQCRMSWLQAVNDRGRAKAERQLATHLRQPAADLGGTAQGDPNRSLVAGNR